MSSLSEQEELRMLLRQVVAGNLTVAYEVELLRRALKPQDETSHPLAQVLEVFETLNEAMEPDEDDALLGDLDDLESLASELAPNPSPEDALRATGAERNPFATTVKYLRARARKKG